jgi:thiol-disulfide isomerase/thioredoxin
MKTRRSIRNLVAHRVAPSSRKAQRRVRLAMDVLEARWLPSTFTVTNLLDDGSVGSLRWAVNQVDHIKSAGISTITFDVGKGAQTIHVGSGGHGPLPIITEPVILDGTTQPKFAGKPLIELDGTDAGALANGLVITAGGTTVRGLVINRFQGSGIVLESGGGNLIEGDYLGTNVSGKDALGNGNGVTIDGSANNTVGGTVPGSRNIISGNQSGGVLITGLGATGNVVLGNYVGTDATGTNALGNGGEGVFIVSSGGANTIGGAAPGARNIISGNGSYGVNLEDQTGVGDDVVGNYIGTDARGNHALGNLSAGVIGFLNVGARIGGSGPGEGNVISGNAIGIALQLDSNDVVAGNFIGTDARGNHALGNAGAGVLSISEVGARIGGPGPGEGNVISGNTIGIDLQSDSNDVVAGNYIGTDARGNHALGNSTAGVILEGASNNLIGGTEDGSGNVISGNGVAGILLRGEAFGNAIAGNRIGTSARGKSYLPNGQMGVGIYQQAFAGPVASLESSGNFVGAVLNADGTLHPAGNLIAGNNGPGVWLNSGGQTVEFNTITGNRGPGVAVSDLPTSPGAPPQSGYLPGDIAPDFTLEDQNGNDVSLSDFAGKYVILAFCASWCVPCGELAQEISGIEQALQDEHIPFEFVEVLENGPTPGVAATIANVQAWVRNFHLSSPVLFGPQAESISQTWGVSALPTMYFLNPGGTIYYEQVGTFFPDVDLASVVSAEANSAFTTPLNDDNTILSNSIWGNGGLGIDLGNDGVTTNTPGTRTSGPNLLQNSPVLTSVTAAAGGKKTVSGYLDSTPNMTFLVQLYANGASGDGQGQDYLGQTLITTDSTGQATFRFTYAPQRGAPFLSATATDDSGKGNTSEFSIVNGAGATIVVNTLYLAGGSTTNDQLKLGNGNNIVVEGDGRDQVRAGNGDNLIVSGGGTDNIQTGNGSDILIDGSGNGACIANLGANGTRFCLFSETARHLSAVRISSERHHSRDHRFSSTGGNWLPTGR